MTSAFCPGHITCFFRPGGPAGGDLLARGSVGVGVRLSKGATASVALSGSDGVRVFMDGVLCEAPVTVMVVRTMLPGRSAVVRIENGLPVGEGFGMSAAGAIATAMCCAELSGADMSAVYSAAHSAEVVCGGGLGDVSGIRSGFHVPIRYEPGLPPYGRVGPAPIGFGELTLAVLGPEMDTGKVLGDRDISSKIVTAGDRAMKDFIKCQTKENLFEVSYRFSEQAGVKSPEVREAIERLGAEGIRSSMCMLGNSIFADASENEVRAVLGDVRTFSCRSSGSPPGPFGRG